MKIQKNVENHHLDLVETLGITSSGSLCTLSKFSGAHLQGVFWFPHKKIGGRNMQESYNPQYKAIQGYIYIYNKYILYIIYYVYIVYNMYFNLYRYISYRYIYIHIKIYIYNNIYIYIIYTIIYFQLGDELCYQSHHFRRNQKKSMLEFPSEIPRFRIFQITHVDIRQVFTIFEICFIDPGPQKSQD